MSILCMVTSLFEFVVLLALTGALVSVVALLHLMGLFISLITPVTTFMLNQSGRLVIYGAIHSKRLMARAYRKTFHPAPLEISLQAPDVAYQRSEVPGLVEETVPLAPDVLQEESAEPVTPDVDEDAEKETEETVEQIGETEETVETVESEEPSGEEEAAA